MRKRAPGRSASIAMDAGISSEHGPDTRTVTSAAVWLHVDDDASR